MRKSDVVAKSATIWMELVVALLSIIQLLIQLFG